MPKQMTKAQAEKNGFFALTTGYNPLNDEEMTMLDAVVADLKRGDIPYTLVPDAQDRLEVWRSKY